MDRAGRPGPAHLAVVAGAAAFGVASILAAYSTSAGMLISARALLGIAGATLTPSTLALISNMFSDPKQRAFAVASWLSCFSVGLIIGPLVGGALLERFWWGSVFLLGAPVIVLLLVAAPVLLPEYRDSKAGRIDLASVALSLGAILPMIYGLKEVARAGVEQVPVAAIVVGAGVGSVFVRRQRRLSSPLLDLRLFGSRTFSAALSNMLLNGVVMAGTFLFVSQYLQMVRGLSALQAGLWLVPQSLAFLAGSQIAPVIARRISPGKVSAAGQVIGAIGLLLLTQVSASSGLVLLVTGFVVAAVGIALPSALGYDLILGSAPPERAGSAGAIAQTSSELGIALGVASLGSLGTAVYRGRLGGAVGSDVPVEAARSALENIAGAVTAAGNLPAAIGTDLLDAAREAFTSGLHTAAGLGGVVFIGLAIVAWAFLRHVRPYGEAQPVESIDLEVATDELCVAAGSN